MPYIAINIALIPPKPVIDEVIRLNSECGGDKENFILSDSDRIPHMTLLMGWIEEKNIKLLEKILREYSDEIQEGIQILSNNIQAFSLPNGGIWQYIDILPNESLQGIYSYIIETIKPLIIYKKIKTGFIENESINDLTIQWTYQHKDKNLQSTYHPHISIGIGELKEKMCNKSFLADSIGIYQLGNYCTCRKLLKSIKL